MVTSQLIKVTYSVDADVSCERMRPSPPEATALRVLREQRGGNARKPRAVQVSTVTAGAVSCQALVRTVRSSVVQGPVRSQYCGSEG